MRPIRIAQTDELADSTGLAVGRREKLVSLLLMVAFYILLFSNMESVASIVQIASVIIVALTAVMASIGGIKRGGLSFFEISAYLCCLISIPAAMLNSGISTPGAVNYISLFSLLTFIVIGAIGVICSSVRINLVMRSASRAYIAMIMTILVFASNEFVAALTPNATDRWALRARAFGLHPNLEGLIFAGGSIILLRQAFMERGFKKFSLYIFSFLSLVIVLGASARASLVAVLGGGVIILLVSFPKLTRRVQISIISAAGIVFFFSVVLGEYVWAYMYEILELGSKTRGLSSGGSGRTDLWERGVELIGSSVPQSLFGGGLRWSTADTIGFSVESSYLTILLDSGLLAGSLLILSIIFSLFRSGFWVASYNKASPQDIFVSSLILFAIIQGFFNRYLFAVGNPFSLIMMFIFIYASRGALTQITGRAGKSPPPRRSSALYPN